VRFDVRHDHPEHGKGGKKEAKPHALHTAPSLLLAINDSDRPSSALMYTSTLASSLGAELHVVRLLPPLRPLRVSPDGEFDFVEATRRIERCVAMCRQTRAWCQSVLGEVLPIQRLKIRFGEFAHEVAGRAAELDASLVVLAPSNGRLGVMATGLARTCARPVLVARGTAPSEVLLAATDLEDGYYRVLRRATELGAALDASVVAVHNVSCLSTPLGVHVDGCVKPAPEFPKRIAGQLPVPFAMVVTTEVDPVDAILAQALRHRSPLIVVGTRRRRMGALHRLKSVPAEIVDRCRCSVLVTPLEPP
jgi:nucleotide-binding universal stress UspA family protein